MTGLNMYYIESRDPTMLRAVRPSRDPQDLLIYGSRPGPATISPCTITMDHDAIICFMID